MWKTRGSFLISFIISISILLPVQSFGQNQAGGLFLLIPPGARAGGMGEAQVAMPNDAFASYYNPAGMAFLEDREISAMHVNWLPGLASDMFYEFLSYRHQVANRSTIGGHISYLNLGEQAKTTVATGTEVVDRFNSYMWNVSLSYGLKVNLHTSLGLNAKIFQQFLAPASSSELFQSDVSSTSYAFDLAFYSQNFLLRNLHFGAVLYNIGPGISFAESESMDPTPTFFKIGFNYAVLNTDLFLLNTVYDISTLVVNNTADGRGVSLFQQIFYDEKGEQFPDLLKHNFGLELWINNMIALRGGGIFQQSGEMTRKDSAPLLTYGAGFRYLQYGIDISYLSADERHPLNNTTRFSVNIGF